MEVMEVFKKYLRHITKYISMLKDKIGEKGKDKVWLQMSYALIVLPGFKYNVYCTEDDLKVWPS